MAQQEIKFYSHRLQYGYMSNFYGIEQDKNFNLRLPLHQNYEYLDPIHFDSTECENHNFPTSEHPYQIQKYILINKTIDSDLQNKYHEYREIMRYLKSPTDVAAMGRQKGSNSACPKLIKGTPKWIKEKCSNILPNIIKEYRDAGVVMRKDWDDVKDKIMYFVVSQKFMQNNHLSKKLQSTGESELIEYTKNDSYWAMFMGKGLNKLGQILMQVRDELV